MMINIITMYSNSKAIYNCHANNDDYYHKGREGGLSESYDRNYHK